MKIHSTYTISLQLFAIGLASLTYIHCAGAKSKRRLSAENTDHAASLAATYPTVYLYRPGQSTHGAPPPPPPPASPDVDTEEVFKVVEYMPLFGGLSRTHRAEKDRRASNRALDRFVQENHRYPDAAKQVGIALSAIVSFTVEKDGSVSKLRVTRDPGYGTAAEVIRLFASMPRWTPGVRKERPSAVDLSFWVVFQPTAD